MKLEFFARCGMLLFTGVSYFTFGPEQSEGPAITSSLANHFRFGAIKSSLEVGANFEMYLDTLELTAHF